MYFEVKDNKILIVTKILILNSDQISKGQWTQIEK